MYTLYTALYGNFARINPGVFLRHYHFSYRLLLNSIIGSKRKLYTFECGKLSGVRIFGPKFIPSNLYSDNMQLLVNIDHIATLRNARGEGVPDPAEAAQVCEQFGARGIVFHLREDRRHVNDEDVVRLKKVVQGKLVFEMAATEEMLEICTNTEPQISTLVPESREELTTEGGLKMKKVADHFGSHVIPRLRTFDIESSLFVDPVEEDIRLAAEVGADAVELHTGTYANANPDDKQDELARLKEGADLARSLGLKVNAGHGLNFFNITPLLKAIPYLEDISIGHALISDAVFNGLGNTIRRMAKLIESHNTFPNGT